MALNQWSQNEIFLYNIEKCVVTAIKQNEGHVLMVFNLCVCICERERKRERAHMGVHQAHMSMYVYVYIRLWRISLSMSNSVSKCKMSSGHFNKAYV